MLRWKRQQRAAVVGILSELANLSMAGLVFAQVISDRPFSWLLVLAGFALWVALVWTTIAIAGVDRS